MIKDSHFMIGLVLLTALFLLVAGGGLLALYLLSASDGTGGADDGDWPADWYSEDDGNGELDGWWDDSWTDDPYYTESAEGDGNSIQESAEDYLAGCEPLETKRAIGENIDITVLYRIDGERSGYCIVYEKVVSDNEGFGLSGMDMTCRIPMDGASDLSLEGMECEGPLSDAIDELTGGGER